MYGMNYLFSLSWLIFVMTLNVDRNWSRSSFLCQHWKSACALPTTKIALIVRKEKGRLRNYFHIGTGNYNSNTSRFYTDIGLLSTDPDISSDLIELFNYLSGFSKQKTYQKLLVSPASLRTKFIFLSLIHIWRCRRRG